MSLLEQNGIAYVGFSDVIDKGALRRRQLIRVRKQTQFFASGGDALR